MDAGEQSSTLGRVIAAATYGPLAPLAQVSSYIALNVDGRSAMRTARMVFEINDYEAADPEVHRGEFGAEIKFSELTSDSTHHYRQLEHFDKLVEKLRARLVAALEAA